MRYYAISDIHGCYNAFEKALSAIGHPYMGGGGSFRAGTDKLVLLGDYISHDWDEAVDNLAYFMVFSNECPDAVLLLGNHEADWRDVYGDSAWGAPYRRWLSSLPLFLDAEQQIFVHAGVAEEACEEWKLGTEDYIYTHKYPPQVGTFVKDIVAGHVAASGKNLRAECENYNVGCKDDNKVFWDGESHFYIDGGTEYSGRALVLIWDSDTREYLSLDKEGREYVVCRR